MEEIPLWCPVCGARLTQSESPDRRDLLVFCAAGVDRGRTPSERHHEWSRYFPNPEAPGATEQDEAGE